MAGAYRGGRPPTACSMNSVVKVEYRQRLLCAVFFVVRETVCYIVTLYVVRWWAWPCQNVCVGQSHSPRRHSANGHWWSHLRARGMYNIDICESFVQEIFYGPLPSRLCSATLLLTHWSCSVPVPSWIRSPYLLPQEWIRRSHLDYCPAWRGRRIGFPWLGR